MKTLKRKFRGDIGELIFYSALIALPLLQIVIFYFYVNYNSVALAFKSYSFEDGFYWDFDANFPKFWLEVKSLKLLRAFKNSLIIWLFTTVLGTFLAIVFAYYIYKKWMFGKTFKFFLFLPSVLPSILLVGIYKFFVNDAIPEYAKLFGATIKPLLSHGDALFPTVVFYNVWICFGSQLLIYTGAMDQISPEIIEAGQVDGVTPIREFFSIVVPMILPAVSTFIIANVATLFTNQANQFAFFGGDAKLQPSDYTLGYYLFSLVGERAALSNFPYASLLGVLCTLIAFPLTVLARRLLNGKEDA